MTEVNSNRNNIVRIMIDDTGKIPKKTYVLNVRKLDRIQQNKRQRLLYSSNLEKNNPVHTNFNHNIIIIKNVTRELPTVLDIGEDGKLTHRYNYSSNTNISNIAHKIINESGKIVKKQVVVSPRKNEVIKSFKKPLKLTYENYVETNTSSIQTGINKIPLPKKTEITKTTTNEKESKITETKSSRIRKEGTGNKTTTATTTKTTTTETKMRLGRNKTEANLNKEGGKENKVTTITKTEISTESNGGKGGRLQISRSGRNISENSGKTTEKKITLTESTKGKGGKVETTTTKEVITEKSSRRGRKGGEGSGAEITKVTKTEITTGSSGDNGEKSRTRIKKESSSVTTTTTTKTVTKTSSEEKPVEGATVVKKFRSLRRVKK